MTPARPPQTSSKRPSSGRGARGMTLIEIIVSLAIISLLIGGAVMGIGALTGSQAKSAAGQLSGTIRALYDTASLTGKTCRLVFGLPSGKDASGFQYWAECASGNITTGADRDATLRSDTKRLEEQAKNPTTARDKSHSTYADVISQEKNRAESLAKFSAFTNEDVKPKKVSGVMVSVWTRHQREPTKSGLAYVYFFPQGYAERAQIYVRQGSTVFTLTVAPLTGKTSVVAEELEVPRS